ncbi:AMP-binding protein [Amycolatopsis pigmentata]|uniref:AMP-binding protein n=1 Tax=Amycolatopsis pigmentata TaxID=450801 RepID=A0ABW5FIN5_9PSEU
MSTEILDLHTFLLDGVHRWSDRPWCSAPDGEATRAEIYADALAGAGALRRRGVTAGDRVAIVQPNGLAFIRAWMAVTLAGAVAVPVNPRAAATELPAVLDGANPALLIAEPGFEVDGYLLPHTTVAELVAPTLRLPDETTVEVETVVPSTHAAYIQSSGSTGKPKFIIQTHAMYTMAAEGFPFWLGLTERDVLMTSLPLAHLNAQAYSTLGSWGCGARLVLLPRFSVGTFWQQARDNGATVVNTIGAMLEMLMAQPPHPEERRHELRLCYSAPAPDPVRHVAIEERFGFRLVIGYAQSESPYGLINAGDDSDARGTMGRPRQHPRLGAVNQARVVDVVTGEELSDGEVGELQLRNPATTPGYAGQPEETALLLRGGWLHTGDLVRRDADGRFSFAGRIKELIRRRGENLSPAEVESVLDAHPAVAASAVVGVPSDLSEEDIKAFVQLADGAHATAQTLGAWCAERLPPYKQPRYVEFVTEWPLTETNKIAKARLPRERNTQETDLARSQTGERA